MKGQRLFVRLAKPDDQNEIELFYSTENERARMPAPLNGDSHRSALIGKVVGEMVAHLAFSLEDEVIRVESIYVARLLRRKWIGRFMISELERLTNARTRRVEVSSDCEAAEFFRAVGFEPAPGSRILNKSISTEEDV